MFSFVKVFITIVLFIATFKNLLAISGKVYVGTKLKETKNILINTYTAESMRGDKNKSYKSKWERLWSKTLTAKHLHTIIFYNQMFLIDDKSILSVAWDSDSIDKIRIVSELNLASSKDSAFSWNKSSFLLVCQTNFCTHYQGSDASKLGNQQIIKDYNSLPVDACFFTHGNQLYLIIAYNSNNHSKRNGSLSKIYQWTGKHMDYTGTISNPAVRTVAIFHDDEQSTFFIFALQHNGINALNTNISCIVYEFKDKNNTEQISFLTSIHPVSSITPYSYNGEEFTLLVSDTSSSGVFWWDGTDLRKWINIPEINSSSLVKIIKINNDTLLFVCNLYALHIYELFSNDCVKISELKLKSGQRIIEMSVWENNKSLMLTLTKLNFNESYDIQLWQLHLHPEKLEAVKSYDVWPCFLEIQNILDLRMLIIENLSKNWLNFLPLSKMITYAIPLQLSKFYINGGKVSLLEFDNDEHLIISNPADIQNGLMKFKSSIDIILTLSKNIVLNNKLPSFADHLVVNGDAYFSKLSIKNLNIKYLNDNQIEMDNILISRVDQTFSIPLRANTISIRNLEIPLLCGLNANDWLRDDNLEKSDLGNINFTNSWIHNDTIHIKDNLILKKVNVNNINGVKVQHFLNNLFTLDKEQVIRGNIAYQGLVQIMNLKTDEVNSVASSKLLTKNSNQTLENIFIDTLEVQRLYVDTINGIPINKAARMSQKNIVKGQVTISNFVITDKITVRESTNLPFAKRTQVYDEILINGNIFVKNLNFEAKSVLMIGNDALKAHNIYDIREKSWTKSKSQIITSSIVFKNGMLIDELDCQHLNGLSEQDFIYTSVKEVNNIGNITFNEFHFDKVINEISGNATNFFEESSNLLIFRKAVRISHLSVDNIFTDKYNGIPIEIVMTNDTLTFNETSKFETVHVSSQMYVNRLQTNRLNLQNTTAFKDALKSNQNLQSNILKLNNIRVRNLQVQILCGQKLEKALLVQETINNQKNKVFLVIEGVVKVKNNLQINEIDGNNAKNYIDLFKNNLINTVDMENMRNLHVAENLNISFLNGFAINDIFDRVLSKTNKQILHKIVNINDANIRYLTAKNVNHRSTSHLMYVDESNNFYGNISFSYLHVQKNIVARTLNSKKISKLQKELHIMPIKNVTCLHILGDLFWNSTSLNLHSVNYLLVNAITKHKSHLINGPVIFENLVSIDSLYLKKPNSTIFQKVNNIFSDTVIDSSNTASVFIKGVKVFKKELVADNLKVINNIDIQYVNELNICEISTNIFQKYRNNTISSQIIFLGDIHIEKLMTNQKIHDIPLHEIAANHKKMPKHLHFNSLIIRSNATLHKLDSVDFDDFKEKRLTVDGDYKIFHDTEMNSSIEVSNESYIYLINGIRPINVIVDNATRIPNVIYGQKNFKSHLFVEENVEIAALNDFDLKLVHNNSLSKKTNFVVFGNLTFENEVEVFGNLNISGHLDGLEFKPILKNEIVQEKLVTSALNEKLPLIESFFKNPARNSYHIVKDQLLYLEKESSLNLNLPEIYTVKSLQIENVTHLDLYAAEAAIFCGLRNGCLCRRQYITETTSAGNYRIHQKKAHDVTFNFYQKSKLLNGFFGVKIISNSVSTSENCSTKSAEPENSKIFWMKFNDNMQLETQRLTVEVNGFIADAQTFVLDDTLYLVLAIFYDKTINSHATESLIYEFNLTNNETSLLQTIATDGAKAINIFKIENAVYLLIGCIKGKSESLLLRFDLKIGKFQLICTFATGGSKHIASVSRHHRNFIILNNPETKALQVYVYNDHHDNFYNFQNLHFESKITSLNVVYSGEFRQSEAFVIATTKDGSLYVYEYMFFGKFQLKISHWIEDTKIISPFRHNNQNYLLAWSKSNGTVIKFIQE